MSAASSALLALPEKSYLSGDNGLKSWLLTLDHKRIALLYLFTTVFFFAIGGTAAAIHSLGAIDSCRRPCFIRYV